LDNGLGIIGGTSVVVSPIITTTYTLFAVNPVGTTTSHTTVTVNPVSTTTPPNNDKWIQIQNLLNQINALKAQLDSILHGGNGSTSTTTPPTIPPGVGLPGSCSIWVRDLWVGSRGDDVRELQIFLSRDDGVTFSTSSATGFFGPKTEQALKKFQKKHGIFSLGNLTSGFFGPKTRGFFKDHCGNDNASTTLKVNQENNDQGDKNENHGKGKGHDN